MAESLAPVFRVLVLKRDRIYAAALQRVVEGALPGALVQRAGDLAEARMALKRQPVDLLLSSFLLPDGDVLPLLGPGVAERGWRRALIVTPCREERILTLLRSAPIAGIFDPDTEDPERLREILTGIFTGLNYWSPSVRSRILRLTIAGGSLDRRLTRMEWLVFAAVGDGSDDETAAARLGMKPSSVQSVRSSLHGKPGVRHRGELVRLAVQTGIVRITADGVYRPDFERMLARHWSKRRDDQAPFASTIQGPQRDPGAEASFFSP